MKSLGSRPSRDIVSRTRLFDDFERSDERPKFHRESDFEFLNRSARPPWERVRKELEAWFSAYPTDEQANLAGRFRDRRREQHLPAWWELYLFRLFTALECQVEIHPDLPESRARVDFRVEAESSAFFVEAVTTFSGIVQQDRNSAREAQVLEAIDQIRSRTFSVSIHFESVGAQTPPLRPLVTEITSWLESLDPDRVAAGVATGAPYPLRTLTLGDWTIELEAFPIAREHRDAAAGRLIGAGPVSVGPVDDVERIRSAVEGKQSKYPPLQEPLVVAVLSVSSFAGLRDFEQALLGTHAVQYGIGKGAAPARWVKLLDGAWKPRRGTRVSAALTAADLTPTQVATKLPFLWRNPWARVPLEPVVPLPEVAIRPDGAVTYPEVGAGDPARIFGLEPTWPGFMSR
jgi:hypothetical protein